MSVGNGWNIGDRGAAADLLRAHLMALHPGRCVEQAGSVCVVPAELVDVRQAAPGLVVLDSPPWSDPELRFLVRPEVAERLERAASMLPSDIRLGFWEGLRPIRIQRSLWSRGLDYLRTLHPNAAGEDLEVELEHYVARPDRRTPPHSTGSAVDVAPVNAFGEVMTPAAAWGSLAVEAVAHALRAVGMAHYQPEWWHWSYGDDEWARAYDCTPLPFSEAPAYDGPGGGI